MSNNDNVISKRMAKSISLTAVRGSRSFVNVTSFFAAC